MTHAPGEISITDADYAIQPSDTLVALTGTLTASRTFTLPLASPGQGLRLRTNGISKWSVGAA